MKKYILLSLAVSFVILVSLAAKIIYQDTEKKISSFNSSMKYEEKKEYNNAIQSLLQNYEENKNDYLFNLRLGWLYYSKGDYSKSKTYYQRAVDIRKNSTEAILALTLPVSKLDDWDLVQSIYQKILKIDPNNFYANLYLGQIYLNKTEYGKAKELLEKIYESNPGSYDVNMSLGWTYYYLGKASNARELFTNVLMLSPNDSLGTKGMMLSK
jgi:tetratricopeptide (TPR) repeat protein